MEEMPEEMKMQMAPGGKLHKLMVKMNKGLLKKFNKCPFLTI